MTSTPGLSWIVPAGEHFYQVNIATADTPTPDGGLPNTAEVTCPPRHNGEHWRCITRPLPAGTYWWQASSFSRAVETALHSARWRFTIKPYIRDMRLSLRSYPASNAVKLVTRWNTDIGARGAKLTYALYVGRKQVAGQRSSDAYLHLETNSFTHWFDFGAAQLGRVIKPGTRLRLVVTVTADGHSESASSPMTAS
ncbi:MAG TPA: hypothetical protein VHU61_13300 [Solirubrobacteraceae bacterium]|nr:hypothetical protein [Solirubrobacteraceae bacterium]